MARRRLLKIIKEKDDLKAKDSLEAKMAEQATHTPIMLAAASVMMCV